MKTSAQRKHREWKWDTQHPQSMQKVNIYRSVGRNLKSWKELERIWINVTHSKGASKMFIMIGARPDLFLCLFQAVIQQKEFQKLKNYCKGPEEQSIAKCNCFIWEKQARDLEGWWSRRFKHRHSSELMDTSEKQLKTENMGVVRDRIQGVVRSWNQQNRSTYHCR